MEAGGVRGWTLAAVVKSGANGGDDDDDDDEVFASAMREGERWRPRNCLSK